MRYENAVKEYIFEDVRPFDSCHASTLLVLPCEDILAAWFGGTKEGAGDVAVWMAKRTGGEWTPPVKAADLEGVPHWNPVLFRGNDGRIFLFYKVGHKIPQWHTMVMTSDNDGDTWTQPKELVEGDIGGRGPVRNKPIVLQDGTWLAPASIEGQFWDAFTDKSYDQGNTWVKSELVPIRHSIGDPEQVVNDLKQHIPVPAESFKGKGVIQPTLWESAPATVHMLLRSTEGCIFRSDSVDGGKTWSPAYSTGLPNNNSGIDLTKLENGVLALAFNPVGENWGPRTPLVLRLSQDNGATWGDELILEDQPGEYSYPAIVNKGNELFITYTWKRQRIAFWRITVK